MATTFKSYSEKSKARRALVQVYGIDKDATDSYLSTAEGKHGFLLDGGTPVYPTKPAEELRDYTDPAVQAAVIAEVEAAPVLVEPVAGAALTEEEQAETDVAPSSFGTFALNQLTAPSNTAPVEPQRTSTSQRVTGLKIEKNREARNGVRMPSVGGMCRAVWDALSNMMTHDEASGTATVPTVADIKKLAEEKGWNVNNASIEYYQWRKWHGITGRGKKSV
jgi:hypothetical protein